MDPGYETVVDMGAMFGSLIAMVVPGVFLAIQLGLAIFLIGSGLYGITFPEGEGRQQFALNALKIGVLALRQARGEVDAQQVRRESERMLLALEGQLSEHATRVHEHATGLLK